MFASNLFNSKIIYHKGEGDWACAVFPRTSHVENFVVSMSGKVGAELVVGKDASLKKAVYPMTKFEVYIAIINLAK